MIWDVVSATRDLLPIPDVFKPEITHVEKALESCRDRIPEFELRQVYSLQSVPEVARVDQHSILVWDWRWVEHVRRTMALVACNVDGIRLTAPLAYLILCERALEEGDASLAKGCILGLKRLGDLSLSQLDEILSDAPDYVTSRLASRNVELAGMMHELAHLLLNCSDPRVLEVQSWVTDRLRELPNSRPDIVQDWAKLASVTNAEGNNLVEYLLSGPILTELTCDMYAMAEFRDSLAQLAVAGDLQDARATVFSLGMYFVFLDFFETARRSFADRRWHFSDDIQRNNDERWIRHSVIMHLLISETLGKLVNLTNSDACAKFAQVAQEAMHLVATARFFLLEPIQQIEYERFRAFLRAMGQNQEVANVDWLSILKSKVDWYG